MHFGPLTLRAINVTSLLSSAHHQCTCSIQLVIILYFHTSFPFPCSLFVYIHMLTFGIIYTPFAYISTTCISNRDDVWKNVGQLVRNRDITISCLTLLTDSVHIQQEIQDMIPSDYAHVHVNKIHTNTVLLEEYPMMT